MEFRNKQFGFKRFLNSFKYSIEGLKYAYLHEQSMFIHTLITLFAVIMGFVFKISNFEWIITIFLLSTAASLELVNTAIEAVVDLVTDKFHPLAKIAKDTASAALFLTALVGFVATLIIYIPKIQALF